jgi:uncharacterized protein (DUF1697 family)
MRYIALLRGINVGGNTMIKMEELRATLEALGFERVASYINSGNIAFEMLQNPTRNKSSAEFEASMVETIQQAIETNFGKRVPVMIRVQAAITGILANNPFKGQFESHKEMHVLFMRNEMPAEKIEQLLAAASPPERFAVIGREIYCHLPMGVADSLLGKSFIEKKLKVAVTARNWRTVERLATL